MSDWVSALSKDTAGQIGFFMLAVGVGIAIFRQHWAKSKGAEAQANGATANVDAASVLFEHYRKELADLRTTVQALGERLGHAEAELAKVEQQHANSAAGEKRYRYAFAKLLQSTSRLMAVARDFVPPECLASVEEEITHLMTELSKPLDTEHPDPEVEIFTS